MAVCQQAEARSGAEGVENVGEVTTKTILEGLGGGWAADIGGYKGIGAVWEWGKVDQRRSMSRGMKEGNKGTGGEGRER